MWLQSKQPKYSLLKLVRLDETSKGTTVKKHRSVLPFVGMVEFPLRLKLTEINWWSHLLFSMFWEPRYWKFLCLYFWKQIFLCGFLDIFVVFVAFLRLPAVISESQNSSLKCFDGFSAQKTVVQQLPLAEILFIAHSFEEFQYKNQQLVSSPIIFFMLKYIKNWFSDRVV